MALKSIKVLDMSRVLAGPFCSMMLGDIGADVIKVESIPHGDDTRNWGPPFAGKDALYFWSFNRNKRSIGVNFKNNESAQLLRDLSTKCDVFIENYIPGKLKKYGLDYDTLSVQNPGLVYCSISGFGQDGPLAGRAGYDVVAAAMGGLLHITGPRGGQPCRVGVAVTDMLTGMYAYSSVLAALLARQSPGNQSGCHIDCSLLASQVAMLSHLGANFLTEGEEATRIGTGHATLVPYQAFETADGRYLVVGAGNNAQFGLLCGLLALPGLAQDSRFLTNSDRVQNRESLMLILESQFGAHPLSYWLQLFSPTGLPHAPVNSIKDVFAEPQVQHLADQGGLVESWSIPGLGLVSVPGNAVRYSTNMIRGPQGKPQTLSQGNSSSVPPPRLGQHTREVLHQELNLPHSDIDRLHRIGAVFVP